MNCPAPESLIPLALGQEDPALTDHLQACPACSAEVARIREGARALREAASAEERRSSPDCLDDLTMGAFLAGSLAEGRRAEVVAHLLACARCRSWVASAGRLVADPAIVSAADPDRATSRTRKWLVPTGLAAAAIGLVLIWRQVIPDRTDHLREPSITSTVAPTPISPLETATRGDRLLWSSVPRAIAYQVRLFDAEGFVLWRQETPDTSALLPDTVQLSTGRTYYWRVEAETDWKRSAASELVPFRYVESRK